MVAYSFKPRFVEAIRLGLEPGPWLPGMKRQTVRADRKRHARPDEELQLYRGMRTKQCFLIGKAVCFGVKPIKINLTAGVIDIDGYSRFHGRGGNALDQFARMDGFASWSEMFDFWRLNHPGIDVFTGVLIEWEPGKVEEAA